MKVKRDLGGDYYIYISKSEAERVRIPESVKGSFRYKWLEAKVKSEGGKIDETLGLTCSNNCIVASAREQITFTREEDSDYPQDINVRVFPSKLDDLLNDKVNFLMTRYDGENKFWIYLE